MPQIYIDKNIIIIMYIYKIFRQAILHLHAVVDI
jgi:hypothetical protein